MSMLYRSLGSRLCQALLTAWLIATLSFAFVQMLPGETALSIAIARHGQDKITDTLVERVKYEEKLDQPLWAQYGQWMQRLVQGDLGNSLVTRKPVIDEIIYHGRFTLGLGALGWLLSYLLALPIGVYCAFRPDGAFDRAITGFTVILASLPAFLLGIGLVVLFSLTLRWLPPAGYRTSAHMLLPALTLALGLSAFSIPVIRDAILQVRQEFYMIYARMRGLSAAAAFQHHGIRNAAIPVITYAALQFAFVVDGFVVIETLFNYPGLGDLLVRSLLARDIPVILAVGLMIGLLYALINMLADLAALWLDPRRRQEARL